MMLLLYLLKEVIIEFILVYELSSDNARDKYINLSEEEKNKNTEYGRNRYHNIFEKKKQKLEEHQKNIVKLTKAESLNLMKNT